MTVKINLDFEKCTLSKCALDILQNGLPEDPDQIVSKLSYKECLTSVAQGKKLQNAPANYLLLGLLRTFCIENCLPEDEFLPGDSVDEKDLEKDLGKDHTLSQSWAEDESSQYTNPTPGSSTDKSPGFGAPTEDKAAKTPKYGRKESTEEKGKGKEKQRKEETCRFYLNGKCKHNVDCRFQHPKICPKFRQDGDCEVKGCAGNCGFLHPNVCRNSLRDKTCTYTECRFFHLKGTKIVEKWSKKPSNGGSSQRNNTSQARTKFESKNRFAGLNQSSSDRGMKKKTPTKKNQNKNQNQKPNTPRVVETVTLEEKKHLGQTLEAIMKRLEAMESRPIYYPQSQVQPLLSPAVPQTGSQTQFQWGTPNQWSQAK